MPASSPPLSVAVVNDYEIVVAGVAAALEPYADRVRVVELDSSLPVLSDVDLVLYDTFGQVQGDGVDLADLVTDQALVVIFSWNTQPDLVDRALAQGAAGYLSKQLQAEEIVQALEAVAAGEKVRPPRQQPAQGVSGPSSQLSWPGLEHGLSAREAEVVALISQGLSNQAIADTTYLSINSVKTYIRAAYRKIGVDSRALAVIWGLEHGFAPDTVRRIRSEGRPPSA